jgi:hypothetical protein
MGLGTKLKKVLKKVGKAVEKIAKVAIPLYLTGGLATGFAGGLGGSISSGLSMVGGKGLGGLLGSSGNSPPKEYKPDILNVGNTGLGLDMKKTPGYNKNIQLPNVLKVQSVINMQKEKRI